MSRVAAVQRVSWGFADQALSSLTNFAVGVLVARTVSPDDFGAFSLAFATYTVALITSRALASEPFMVRHSATSDEDWRAATRGSSGIALVVGLVAAGVIAIVGVLAGGPVGLAFVALAVVLPGLLVQDMWRFAFIAHGRSYLAFLVDLFWLGLLVPGLLVLDATGTATIVLPIVVWGGAASMAAVVSHLIARTTPSFAAARLWWTRQRDIGPRYVAEALISLGATQLAIYALVTFAGLAAAGAMRGSQILLGPIQVLLMGIGITAVPEGVRLMNRGGPASLRKPAVAISAAIAGLTIAWGIFVNALPDEIGVALLGETWPAAQQLILPLAIAYAVTSLSLGPGTGLRVLADARRSLRARAVDGVSQAIGGVLGAWQLGALGTAVGLAIGGIAGVIAHWTLFFSALRGAPGAPRPPRDVAPTDPIAPIEPVA